MHRIVNNANHDRLHESLDTHDYNDFKYDVLCEKSMLIKISMVSA